MSEIEATLARINGHKGVLGTLIVGNSGQILRQTGLSPEVTEHCVAMVPELSSLARSMIRDLDPQNDLEFLRLRSEKYEIMVAPREDFVLIVI